MQSGKIRFSSLRAGSKTEINGFSSVETGSGANRSGRQNFNSRRVQKIAASHKAAVDHQNAKKKYSKIHPNIFKILNFARSFDKHKKAACPKDKRLKPN